MDRCYSDPKLLDAALAVIRTKGYTAATVDEILCKTPSLVKLASENTIYMNAALAQLQREGHLVRNEDVARLSPLIHDHINVLGRYSFAVPEAVTRGELRQLRTPNNQA